MKAISLSRDHGLIRTTGASCNARSRALHTCVVSIGLLVSCTDNSEPEVCFPLPAGAEVMLKLANHGVVRYQQCDQRQ